MSNDGKYDIFDDRLNTIVGRDDEAKETRYNYWRALTRARSEYAVKDNIGNRFDVDTFSKWMSEEYGLQIILLNGFLSGSYEIVDEHKHLIFKLKYG